MCSNKKYKVKSIRADMEESPKIARLRKIKLVTKGACSIIPWLFKRHLWVCFKENSFSLYLVSVN
jgi:hypothetical protein